MPLAERVSPRDGGVEPVGAAAHRARVESARPTIAGAVLQRDPGTARDAKRGLDRELLDRESGRRRHRHRGVSADRRRRRGLRERRGVLADDSRAPLDGVAASAIVDHAHANRVGAVGDVGTVRVSTGPGSVTDRGVDTREPNWFRAEHHGVAVEHRQAGAHRRGARREGHLERVLRSVPVRRERVVDCSRDDREGRPKRDSDGLRDVAMRSAERVGVVDDRVDRAGPRPEA